MTDFVFEFQHREEPELWTQNLGGLFVRTYYYPVIVRLTVSTGFSLSGIAVLLTRYSNSLSTCGLELNDLLMALSYCGVLSQPSTDLSLYPKTSMPLDGAISTPKN